MRRQASLALALPLLMLAACGAPSQQETAEQAAAPASGEAPGGDQAATPTAAVPGENAIPAQTPETVPLPAPVAATAIPPASFAQCRSCHSVEPGKNGIGPSLHAIFGQQAGQSKGFKYSPALAQSGITWTRAELDQWMAAPTKKVPGTRMVMGMRNEQQRQEVIDYLESLK